MSNKLRYLLIILGMLVPAAVTAHGGVKQLAGDVIVTSFQTPLSPLVGERVTSTYVFTDSAYRRLPGKAVSLTLIDTYHGDESRDRVVLTRTLTTDANGQIEFAHTFDKSNYFDVDLSFTDTSGAAQTTGFLIQTRQKPFVPWGGLLGAGIVVGAVGGAAGYAVIRPSVRHKRSR